MVSFSHPPCWMRTSSRQPRSNHAGIHRGDGQDVGHREFLRGAWADGHARAAFGRDEPVVVRHEGIAEAAAAEALLRFGPGGGVAGAFRVLRGLGRDGLGDEEEQQQENRHGWC
ncbi:hypothetical protein J4558_13975 [Leptolyngbya sp. 15MV]|nr:hypothetical protein J4558_13975 [Leptolyngbya sp. 15MV]